MNMPINSWSRVAPPSEELWAACRKLLESTSEETAAAELSRVPAVMERFANSPRASVGAFRSARRLVLLIKHDERMPMQSHNRIAMRQWVEYRDPEALRPRPETPRTIPRTETASARSPGADPKQVESTSASLTLFGEDGCVRVDVSRGPGNEWMRLNDLHRASGLGRSKEPGEWFKNESTKTLILSLAGDPPHECFRAVTGGNDPGTDARWEISVAYAEWLSPAFHLRVIREWRQFNELKHIAANHGADAAIQKLAELVQADRVSTTNKLASIESRLLRQGDGKHLTIDDLKKLRGTKRRCADLMVKLGDAASLPSANGTLQRGINDATKTSCPLNLLPPLLYPIAEQYLRKEQIKLERKDALGKQSEIPDVIQQRAKRFDELAPTVQVQVLASMHRRYAEQLASAGCDRPLHSAWRASYEEFDRQYSKRICERASEKSDSDPNGHRCQPLDIIREDGDLVRFYDVVKEVWEK